MKQLIILLFVAFSCQMLYAQKVDIKVDSITTTEGVVTGMYYRVIKSIPDTSQVYYATLGQLEQSIPESQQKFRYLSTINKVQEKAFQDTTYIPELRSALFQDYQSTRRAMIEARYNFIQLKAVRDTLTLRSK